MMSTVIQLIQVTEVLRQTKDGFDRGCAVVEGSGDYCGQKVRVEFQNENLVAIDVITKTTIVTCPDLICIVDSDSGEPIATEDNRYGLRVSVVVLPAMPAMCTAKALEAFGPKSFGYKNLQYKPFCSYREFQPITKLV